MNIPSHYDERQRRIIETLTDRGLVLRTDPGMKADFRIVGDQVTLNIDVAEKLLDLPPRG